MPRSGGSSKGHGPSFSYKLLLLNPALSLGIEYLGIISRKTYGLKVAIEEGGSYRVLGIFPQHQVAPILFNEKALILFIGANGSKQDHFQGVRQSSTHFNFIDDIEIRT
jgi:hypothetical protein